MSLIETQFSLNRPASKKQFPISNALRGLKSGAGSRQPG